MIGPGDIGLGTLRARGISTAAGQMAVERALQSSAIDPPDLPPDAILLIRRMVADLTPRRRPHEAHWSARLSDDLANSAARAIRPRGLYVPEDAEAVLFQTRDLWIACVLARLARGLGPAWWCAALLNEAATPARPEIAIGAILAQSPTRVPAVLALLARASAAPEVLTPLPQASLRGLLMQLAETFRLDAIRAVCADGNLHIAVMPETPLTLDRGGPVPDGSKAAAARQGGTAPDRAHVQQTTRIAAARRAVLVHPGALPELLIAVAMMVRDRPAHLAATDAQLALIDSVVSPEVARATHSHTIVPRSKPPLPAPFPDVKTIKAQGAPPAPKAKKASQLDKESSAPVKDAARPITPVDLGQPATDAPAPERPTSKDAKQTDQALPQSVTPEDGIETAYGGIFYLLNLFEAVDLPAALDSDWQLSQHLSPWDLLSAVAQITLAEGGDAPPDPVWAVLAKLAGRDPGDPIGAALTTPEAYQIPPLLAARLCAQDTPWHWARKAGRLRRWTPGGIILADAPSDDDINPGPPGPARRAPWSDRARALHLGPVFNHAPALQRLMGFLVPALRAALVDLTGSDTMRDILTLRAWLYPGPSHIDLKVPIDAVSLSVRLAGLDRDPGWLPAWGRVVTFHFN